MQQTQAQNELRPSEVIRLMEERHSVRNYEQYYAIPQEHLETILKAAATAPSSWNLQHWKFLVVESREDKEKLLPIANGQRQVVDSSVTVAVLGDLEANKNAEAVYGELVAKGLMPAQVKDTLLAQIEAAYSRSDAARLARDEAIRNSALAAMQLMLAAKALGYDTCPMGGFNPRQLMQAFNIPERYVPLMLISVGKAAKPAHASSRLPLERMVVRGSF
ncbi:NAD(P)H nitroreductase [Gordoniibacillus kamchatkensis]|uniref:NAD(P)H nitroreductase n=1 Tax=Gordoniibacillus kamchatkensis TaxID=1590651 RepID=A0ABR5A5F0_9BACL|nr:NAD(P)H nitroreductase [Paenibacillus sp. VKM B-2647]